jgi:hypothetical protein
LKYNQFDGIAILYKSYILWFNMNDNHEAEKIMIEYLKKYDDSNVSYCYGQFLEIQKNDLKNAIIV